MNWTARTCGALLVLLGVWGGLIPFVGPYFHYSYSPANPWIYTSGRLWLEILPGLGTLAGGLTVSISKIRSIVLAGAWLAALSGSWFAVGTAIAPVWIGGTAPVQGTPTGTGAARALEQIGFFDGLGVVIVFVAVLTLGRFSGIAFRGTRRPMHRRGALPEPMAETGGEPTEPVAETGGEPAKPAAKTGGEPTEPVAKTGGKPAKPVAKTGGKSAKPVAETGGEPAGKGSAAAGSR
jgi:hypothetical protein